MKRRRPSDVLPVALLLSLFVVLLLSAPAAGLNDDEQDDRPAPQMLQRHGGAKLASVKRALDEDADEQLASRSAIGGQDDSEGEDDDYDGDSRAAGELVDPLGKSRSDLVGGSKTGISKSDGDRSGGGGNKEAEGEEEAEGEGSDGGGGSRTGIEIVKDDDDPSVTITIREKKRTTTAAPANGGNSRSSTASTNLPALLITQRNTTETNGDAAPKQNVTTTVSELKGPKDADGGNSSIQMSIAGTSKKMSSSKSSNSTSGDNKSSSLSVSTSFLSGVDPSEKSPLLDVLRRSQATTGAPNSSATSTKKPDSTPAGGSKTTPKASSSTTSKKPKNLLDKLVDNLGSAPSSTTLKPSASTKSPASAASSKKPSKPEKSSKKKKKRKGKKKKKGSKGDASSTTPQPSGTITSTASPKATSSGKTTQIPSSKPNGPAASTTTKPKSTIKPQAGAISTTTKCKSNHKDKLLALVESSNGKVKLKKLKKSLLSDLMRKFVDKEQAAQLASGKPIQVTHANSFTLSPGHYYFPFPVSVAGFTVSGAQS